MRLRWIVGLVAIVLGALSCSILSLPTEPTPGMPQPSKIPDTDNSTPESMEAATEGLPAGRTDLPEEAILILEPGPGSLLVSTIHVAGFAGPAWEQTLSVELLSDDGRELSRGGAMINAELGQRGRFAADIPFTVTEMRNGFLRVFHSSPRDGGILHLSSVGVTLAPDGADKVTAQNPHPEDLVIFVPEPGASIQGGTLHVEGFAIANFEQTLLVEVHDEQGGLLGSQPVIVSAPDWGMPGPFTADIPYAVASEGAGRVVVRDISPAFGGDVHRASVEVTLQP